MPIKHLKALLKELGFEWNGASCSIQQLLFALKEYLSIGDKATITNDQVSGHRALINLKKERPHHSTLDIVRDLLYLSGKTLYQLFREMTHSDVVTVE